MRFQEVTHPDDLGADLANVARLIAGERRTFAMEKRYLRRDGSPVWINLSVTLVRQQGEPSHLISVIEDIDARKRAEQALVAERARLRTILESIPVGVLVVDAKGEVRLANPKMEQIVGYVGGPVEAYHRRVRPRRSDGSEYEIAGLPVMRALRGEVVHAEHVIHEVDGREPRILEASAVPIRDGERVVAAVAMIEDVTDRSREERAAAERAEFEKQLIGIVSHDLRNPLGAINMAITIALRRVDDPRVRVTLSRALQASDRAARLIADLLDFTRARLGSGLPIAPREVDVHEIAQQVIEEVEIVHPERRIVHEAIGDGRGQLDGDRLAQVLTNLITNAVGYSPDGATVTVLTRGDDGWMTIAVHNGGAPIAPAVLDQIFEPLQRGTEQGGGIGLGLFIVREVVRAHGGTVEVRSTEDEGTTFTVRVPRHPNR